MESLIRISNGTVYLAECSRERQLSRSAGGYCRTHSLHLVWCNLATLPQLYRGIPRPKARSTNTVVRPEALGEPTKQRALTNSQQVRILL